MFLLGSKVVIVSGRYEQNLSIGMYGYVMRYDKDPNSIFSYVVFFPKLKKNLYMVPENLELEEILIQRAAENVIRQQSIDFAVDLDKLSRFLHSVDIQFSLENEGIIHRN